MSSWGISDPFQGGGGGGDGGKVWGISDPSQVSGLLLSKFEDFLNCQVSVALVCVHVCLIST